MESQDLDSSSLSLHPSNESLNDNSSLSECEGAQPYLFEPYDSELNSDTDSTSESEEEQHE